MPRSLQLSVMQCLVLMKNVMDSKHAGNDADYTVNELIRELSKKVYVKREVIESALYNCNLQDEEGEFWHPFDSNFDAFLARVLGSRFKFDKQYNLIEDLRDGSP